MGTFARVVVCSIAFAAGSAGIVAQTTPAGPPSTRSSSAYGSTLYATYCASCHGPGARGDGPLADAMRRRPANLVEIAKRNKGVFPKELVFRIVDGRQPVRGHGGPDMPVWGDAFTRAIEGGGEEAVKNRIQAIVDYLETIQERSSN
jgi:mono/diheme cytochrome c family protein